MENYLYKRQEDLIYKAKISHIDDDGIINIVFSADSGKHGANEILDEFTYTPEELLFILQKDFLNTDIVKG